MGIYDTARPFFGSPPSWMSAQDGERAAAYLLYEDLYANESDAFKITLRDDEESPIYIPSAKRIVNTFARYVCKGLGFQVTTVAAPGQIEEEPEPADPTAAITAIIAYGDLFNRERFFAQFRSAMKYGLALADWCMFIYADPLKPEGTRISIKAVDPGMYFPIFDPVEVDRVVGVRLVEQIIEDNKTLLRVQRWLTPRHFEHPNYNDGLYVEAPITYDQVVLELNDWEDPKKRKVVRTDIPLAIVPGIFQLPVYHFKAQEKPGEHFGISILQGMERLFFGINQTVTDENVALAMQGLGLYVTTNKPVDAQGNEVDWVIGPRRVMEVKSDSGKAADAFARVPGITSVQANQDHYKYLQEMIETTLGVSDVALGTADVQTAESGIALAIRLGPLIDAASDADELILAKLRQLFYDLRQWFQVYESTTFDETIEIVPVIGPKLPVDREKERATYSDLHLAGVIPTRLYIEKLNELGYDLGDPAKLMAEVAKEQDEALARQQEVMAAADPGAGRLDEEAGGPPDDEVAA